MRSSVTVTPCDDIQRRASYWVQQGTDRTSRYASWIDFCRTELSFGELSVAWLQLEAKKLEDLYEPPDTASTSTLVAHSAIRQRCSNLRFCRSVM
ncbi:hypothetical protein V8E55_009839 [Tylopilus felleus]